MFFSIVALAVAAVGQTVFANPLSTRVTTNVGSSFPKSELNVELVAPHSNITLGHNGLHPDATQATFPADLLLCFDSLCSSCEVFDLSTVPLSTCEIEFFFNSVAISQPSGSGLPFAVFITPPNLCATGAQVPIVNTCFSVTPNSFDDFILEL